MDLLEPPQPWQPVTGGERYAALDVLRGLALFGVLMMNLETCFRISLAAYALDDRHYVTPSDHVVAAILAVVLQSKAFTLFSFSFGIGMAVQAERATPRGANVQWFLVRRLFVLLGLGACHMFLIWNGDILMLYAVCGLLLVPMIRTRPAVLALLGVAAITLNLVFKFDALFPSYELYQALAARAQRIHAAGNYVEILCLHGWEVFQLSIPCLVAVLPRTFGLMLLGVAAWKSSILREPQRHRVLQGIFLGLGLMVGGSATALLLFWPAQIRASGVPAAVFEAGSFIPLSLAYAAAVFFCLGSTKAVFITRPLAAVGQMALTNYLMQSVVLGFVFFGYGLALQGKLGPATAALIGISLYAGQLILSPLWLARFQFGPVEWLWRSLTYGKMQPILRRAAH